MCLNIRADIADISSASVALATMAIDVDDATLSRCRIDMVLNPDTATTPAPAAADTSDMTLRLGRVRLRQLDYTMRMLPVIDSLSTHIADATLLEGNIAMREQSISLRSLIGSGLAAAYIESVGGNHGVAVLHDVEPCEFEAQRRPQTDAFKAYLHIFGVGKAFGHGTAQCFLSPWRIERQNAARYQEYGSEQDEKQYSDYFSDDVHNAVCVTNVFLLIENRLVRYLFSAGAFFSRSMSSKSLLQAFSSRSSTSSKPSAPS